MKNDGSFFDEQRVGQKVNPQRVKNENNIAVLTRVCDTCDSKKSTLLLEGARTHVCEGGEFCWRGFLEITM